MNQPILKLVLKISESRKFKVIIYKLTNTINGKKYVGQTIFTVEERWKEHVADTKRGSNRLLCKAIRKYGENSFILTQIDTATSKEELNKKEVEWIAELKTFRFGGGTGYNMNIGGGSNSGYKASEETKKKLSIASTGRLHTEEAKAKIGEAHLGREITWDGKISVGMKKVFNEDLIVREQILNNVEKMIEGNKKPIEVLIDKVWTKFDSTEDFCKFSGAKAPNVWEVVGGKTDTIKGYQVRSMDAEISKAADAAHQARKNKKGAHKSVKCVETGEVFKNSLAASKVFEVRVSAIYDSVKKGWACKLPKQNKKVHFELVK